jgi:ankyrin repeat protein
LPRLPFSEYIHELELEDGRRRGIRGSVGDCDLTALRIGVSRGQESLVRQFQKRAPIIHSPAPPCPTGDPSLIKRVLRLKQRRNSLDWRRRDEWGRMLIHWAAENGQTAMVRWLIEDGSMALWPDSAGKLPLDLAAQNGHTETVKLLLTKLPRTNPPPKTRAFHTAVKNGHVETAQFLLARKADVNAKDGLEMQRSALHLAAARGLDEMIRLLLDHGADLEAADLRDQTALCCAISAQQEKTVELLLGRGANCSFKNRMGESAVHFAAMTGNIAIFRHLLNYGAALNARCSHGTALHHAAEGGHKSLVRLLLDSGMHVDAKERFPYTPLILAVSKGHTDTASLLLSCGANVHTAKSIGFFRDTALHVAAGRGDIRMTRLLLDYGAYVNTRNNAGRTALHSAIAKFTDRNGAAVISLLLEQGADPNALDKNKQNPLHYATKFALKEVCELLLDHVAHRDAGDYCGHIVRYRMGDPSFPGYLSTLQKEVLAV